MHINKKTAYFFLLTTSMLWGFAFTAQDSASVVPAFTLGALRSIIAGIFLIFVIMFVDKYLNTGRKLFSKEGIDLTHTEVRGGVICGFLLALATSLQQFGIGKGTDGGKAAFITALYVVMVPIYSVFLRKKVERHVWISVGIALVGFYLLCIKQDFSMEISDLWVLLGTMGFPIHILAIDYYTARCDGVRLSTIQFFSSAAVNAVLAFFLERPFDTELAVTHIFPILYLGIVSSGIAYTLEIVAQREVNPTASSLILSLESVFGVLGTAMFLGKTLTVREYLGCGIVFFAVILSQLNFKSKNSKKTAKA